MGYRVKFKLVWVCLSLGGWTVKASAADLNIPVSTQPVSAVISSTPVVTVEASALDVRANREREWRQSGLYLLPYRPNYILPYAQILRGTPSGANAADLQDIEAKFQFSFKASIASGLFWGYGILQLGYTQLSLWQVYNRKLSAPFRESDYEPEAMVTFDTPLRVFGWALRYVSVSIDHQSNGQSDPNSRSWNRVYGQVTAGRGPAMISLRPWVRLPEPAGNDDNPDIERFMGNFELRAAYDWKGNIGSIMWRNNLRADNKGAVELDYSFPLFKRLRGYLQYFNGYGETLIDYNHPISRVGAGLSFSDWL